MSHPVTKRMRGFREVFLHSFNIKWLQQFGPLSSKHRECVDTCSCILQAHTLKCLHTPRWMSPDRYGLRPSWKGKILRLEIDTSQIRSNKQVFVCACHMGPFMGAIWGFEVEWMTDPKMDSFPYDVWLSHLGFQYKRNEPTIARWWGFTPDRQRDTITSIGMTSKIYAHTTSMYMKHTYAVTYTNKSMKHTLKTWGTHTHALILHKLSHICVAGHAHTYKKKKNSAARTGWHCAHVVSFITAFAIHNL